MARTKTANDKEPTVQTAVRLDAEVVARLDAIAAKMSRPGLEVTRTDALRIALMTGLEKIEKER
jgi:predicted transcriptional regulator